MSVCHQKHTAHFKAGLGIFHNSEVGRTSYFLVCTGKSLFIFMIYLEGDNFFSLNK